MRGRKVPLYNEALIKALSKLIERLDIVIDTVNISRTMTEVNVRSDEPAIRSQNICNFRQFSILMIAHVLEEPLGHNDVELLIVKLNGILYNIDLKQTGIR